MQYIITKEGLAELDKYFIEHKDSIIKFAWKNFKDKNISPYPYNPQAEREKVLDEYDVKEHRDWYNPLEHLELKFTQMIGAVEETAVDGQLTKEDHTKYEMLCLCRERVKRKIAELRQKEGEL